MRILTKLGIFNDKDISKISSMDIPIAKNNAKIAPAEDPDISFTSASEDSRVFKAPMSENIPIDAGPSTRYFIFLLNRTEEIGDAKAQTQPQTQPHVSQQRGDWSARSGRHHPTLGGE
jgi:hypothetical protein